MPSAIESFGVQVKAEHDFRQDGPDDRVTDAVRQPGGGGEPAAPAVDRDASGRVYPRAGWLEVLAVVGLILIWPVGVVLLWLSRVWSRREKLIGMLLLPGGYALPAILIWWMLSGVPVWTCTTDPTYANDQLPLCPPLEQATLTLMVGTVLFDVLLGLTVVLPVVGSVYLARTSWRSTHRPSDDSLGSSGEC